jgi:glycosyltransferase involved in cell wall biosynthesis
VAFPLKTRSDPIMWVLVVLLEASVAVHVPHRKPAVRLSYFAPFLSPSGFASEAWDFAVGLSRISEVDLELIHHGDTYDEAHVSSLPERHRALARLFQRDWSPQRMVLCHSSPDAMSLPEPKWTTPPALECPPPHKHGLVIARAMYETDTLPRGWRERLERADEVWVPTQFHKEVFHRGGLRNVAVVGESVDTEAFDPARTLPLTDAQVRAHTVYETRPPVGTPMCRIVSSGKWEERKGFEALVRSFRNAFADKPDRAELLILSRPFHDNSTWNQRVEPLLARGGGRSAGPRVAVLENLPPSLLPGFYLLGDAFALATRGEGWGRPFAEAMAMERVVIATNFSGQTEYMRHNDNALLTRCALVDRGDGHRWAEVYVGDLSELLIAACNPNVSARMRDIGRRARETMVSNYSIDALANTIFERLKYLQSAR